MTEPYELYETDRREIGNLLVGHRVTRVSEDTLLLDDGTLLRLAGHDGGCACSAGCYELTELNGVDNIITAVELLDHPSGDDHWIPGEDLRDGYYEIFVFADNVKVNLATFTGDDGNGYYGTGYTIHVTPPTPSRLSE